MKILYISSACKRENQDIIDKTAKKKQTNTIIKFHNSIIEGLNQQNTKNSIMSLIGLPISIKTNKKIIWKQKIEEENEIIYNQVGFINLPVVKQLTINTNMKRKIRNWIKCNKETDDKVIIVDASYVSVLPMIMKLAIKNNVKVIGIFADIYDYMCKVDKKTNKPTIVKQIVRNKMKQCYNSMFSYVFLTENMNELINKEKKPYTVMEGLIDPLETDCNIEKIDNKTIMYAGELREEYGVKCIVEAFEQLDGNYEFIICGNGKLEDYVQEKANKNNKIKYLGTIPNKEVMKLEKKVTLLVNPRFSNYEYTKYSFPSKIMEYMASGTPVLTTKLPGIPKEYYNYLYLINDETQEGMKQILQETLSLKREILEKRGAEAKKFVLKNKNNKIQTQKIIKMIKENKIREIQ